MTELLLSCQDLSKAFGSQPLFQGLSFGIFEGDHLGVVGPNGSGKSTLLKILAGLESPSGGTPVMRRGVRVGYVAQNPTFSSDATVGAILAAGLRAEHLGEQEIAARVARVMGRAGFADAAQPAATLSGGWRKRLVIARELVSEPDLLLLDEPTNHLDLDGILWLEDLLVREPKAFVAVSHDRYFLEAAAGRMLELNSAFASGLFEVRGRYSEYLAQKDEALAQQASYQESLRNRVRGELSWLARKARARTRKAQARIDQAERLQAELRDLDRRSQAPSVDIEFTATERRTKRLVVATGLTKAFGPKTIVRGLDLVLSPGQRLGLLGANGSGKTTLLRLLAGLTPPESGSLEHAPGLRVVTFDQHRSRLDPQATLRRTLAPAGDSVVSQGRALHVAAWAKRFLFRADQLDTPLGRLSGGEQARSLIARLMLEPADLLLLDEPTNDLDIPTLEVLEESLLEFPGALVLVTHDRYLLDRVSTRLLALDGQGGATFYADYAQWEQSRRAAQPEAALEAPAPRERPSAGGAATDKPRRLGYLEQREWDEMEGRILAAELELQACREAASDPRVAPDQGALRERLDALATAQAAVDHLYARWAELEAKTKA